MRTPWPRRNGFPGGWEFGRINLQCPEISKILKPQCHFRLNKPKNQTRSLTEPGFTNTLQPPETAGTTLRFRALPKASNKGLDSNTSATEPPCLASTIRLHLNWLFQIGLKVRSTPYPPVIKCGWPENGPLISDSPMKTPRGVLGRPWDPCRMGQDGAPGPQFVR